MVLVGTHGHGKAKAWGIVRVEQEPLARDLNYVNIRRPKGGDLCRSLVCGRR